MSKIEFVPLQPYIGAEVKGVDLNLPLGRDEIATLRAGLLKYKAIFFRDQLIDRESHVRFGRYFGDPEIHPMPKFRLEGFPEIFPVKAERTYSEILHSDVSYLRCPAAASILRAVVLPSLGGDTVFVNAVSAYEALSEEVKNIIERLTAVHEPNFHRVIKDQEQLDTLNAQYPPREHPIVRVHPETGERLLFVSEGFTSRIVGLGKEEGRELLRLLVDQFKKPEHQVRFAWKPGSIAFWDNRATQHCAVPGFVGDRYLERVTLNGEEVVGPAVLPSTGQ